MKKQPTKETIKQKEIFSKEFKEFVEKNFDKLKDFLILDCVTLVFNYVRGEKWIEPNKETIFDIAVNKPYHQVHINIYQGAVKMFNRNKDILVEGMIHELCHIHTHPLTSQGMTRFCSEEDYMARGEELTDIISKYVKLIICLQGRTDKLTDYINKYKKNTNKYNI